MIKDLNIFNLETLKRNFPNKKRICVVGNGPVGRANYEIIERSDIVVRFNDWNRRRTHNKDTGDRCDILVSQFDAAPIFDKGGYNKPSCVVIAIPHPFHSERVSNLSNSMWDTIDVNMINPYVNEECCKVIRLDSPGNRHPVSTVGFTFLYHCSKFLPDDYSVHVCGFTCKFDYATKKFDQNFPTNKKHLRHQNHCYVNEFWWIHDNLIDDSRFRLSRNFHHIVKMVKNIDKCSENFNDLEKLMDRIISGKPFALTRYGDYEIRAIQRDILVGPNSKSWILDPENEKDQVMRDELRQSYKYQDPNKDYIVGWHPKFDIPDDASNHIINACVLANSNYNHMLDKLVFTEFPKRKTVLICNGECDPSKLPFTPEKVFFISEKQSCWRYGDIQDELEKYLTSATESHIVLFAAGPYACTVIWKAWSKGIKNHFLLDIGSILDPYLFGRNTRGYHKSLSPSFKSVESYEEVKKCEAEGIPNVIHFVWTGADVPKCGQNIIDMFKQLNPDHDVKVHDGESLDPKYQNLYAKCTRECQKADLIRASVLENEGGWYFDIDMYPFSPVDKITGEYNVTNFFICKQRDGRINNACIASSKHHPIWKSFFSHVESLTEYSRTAFGPECYSQIIPDDMACDDASMFYPVNLRNSAHNIFHSLGSDEEYQKHLAAIKKRTRGREPHMLHLWGLPTTGTSEDIFTEIYKKNKWRFGSGAGSLKRVCTDYVKYLNKFIESHDIKSVLDVGCGDWQFSEDINWKDAEYLGIDVVEYLMSDVAKKYGTDKIKFHFGDIHSIEFDHYDIILIKEVMIHLPNEEIVKMLQKVSGKCKYLIITNPVSNSPNCNIDIRTGSFRPVDVTEKPFNLVGDILQLFPKRKDIRTVVIEDFVYEV